MKKYYLLYECDSYRSYGSYALKGIYTNKANAIKHFNACKSYYKKDDDWYLNIAEYKQNDASKDYKACTNNILYDTEYPFLTTENYE